MTRWLAAAFLMASLSAPAVAQEQVDLELMTYPEVAAAMQHGKTTVLIFFDMQVRNAVAQIRTMTGAMPPRS